MNFNLEQRERYLAPARAAGYEIYIHVFHVPREICKTRCRERKGHPTITTEKDVNQAIDFFFRSYERVEDHEADTVTRRGWEKNQDSKAIICDLDGTLCNVDHRLQYVKVDKPLRPQWGKFFAEMKNDTLNEWCKEITDIMAYKHPIVFATGRPEDYMEMTKGWLSKYDVTYNYLFSRLQNDHRKDDIVKEIILEFEIKTRFDIHFIIDDRQQVVNMWRKHGYTVLQCAKGDF